MPNAALPLPLRKPRSKCRPAAKNIRRVWLRLIHYQRAQGCALGALVTLCFMSLILYLRGGASATEEAPIALERQRTEMADGPASLFIAIGSAPGNFELRDAAREGWLRWLPDDGSVSYRFFSDAPPSSRRLESGSRIDWARLRREVASYNDVVLQPLQMGYGDKEHNVYAQRGRYQAAWALQHATLTFFLRVDDDSFLCLHKLLYELKSMDRRQLFWGRFWCREGRNRADENFMLFSSDVVQLLANEELVGRLLPFDEQVTLGWNFGYWSWVLNLTVFDDQKRLDAQQGYLTEYMHQQMPADDKQLAVFCDNFIYAHHVKASTMRAAYKATKTHMMYHLPRRTGPQETCSRRAQTFVPARHSKLLPDLRIGRSANAPK